MTKYTVKSGDTLSAIARDQLGDMSRWPEIAQLNNIKTLQISCITAPCNPVYLIYPGNVLTLPDKNISSKAVPAPVTLPSSPGAPALVQSKISKGWMWGLGGLLAAAVAAGVYYKNKSNKSKTKKS